MRWCEDPSLIRELPLRYRAYAAYSRLAGNKSSRRVPGGSFLLRALKTLGRVAGLSTKARIRGIDGLTVVTDFADERILEVIHEIRGENPEYRVMQSLLSPGATFVDVGANFGTFSLLGSRLVGVSGKVIAIEAQARLTAMIAESVASSGVTNCEIVNAAAGKDEGTATLLVPRDDSGRAGYFEGFSGKSAHDKVAVKVKPLDEILSGTARGMQVMVKIDVEGSEMDVIDGAPRTIAELRPAMMIELNPWSAAAAGRSTSEIIDRLVSFGYGSFSTADAFPQTFDASHLPTDRQINLIAR